jgi:hypothetical protein
MPNTKSLPRLERKAAKRKIRRGDKELYRGLTQKQRREFRESKNGIKLFVAEKQAAAQAAEQAAAQAAKPEAE